MNDKKQPTVEAEAFHVVAAWKEMKLAGILRHDCSSGFGLFRHRCTLRTEKMEAMTEVMEKVVTALEKAADQKVASVSIQALLSSGDERVLDMFREALASPDNQALIKGSDCSGLDALRRGDPTAGDFVKILQKLMDAPERKAI